MKKSKTKVVYKVFSLLLTVFMLNSLILIPSVSATQYHEFVTHGSTGGKGDRYLFGEAQPDKPAATTTNTNVYGIGGKDATDLSAELYAPVAASPYNIANISADYKFEDAAYCQQNRKAFLCSYNIYPVNGVNRLELRTNVGYEIGRQISSDALIYGRWNRIVYLYDRNIGEYGTNTTYVNGKQYGEPFALSKEQYDYLLSSDSGRTARNHRATINLAAGGKAYFDDFMIERPDKTVSYTGVPYVEGDFVFEDTIAPGITPAQIKAATVSGIKGFPNPVTVKAYRGGVIKEKTKDGETKQEPLSEDTVLEEGDIVMLEETLSTNSNAAPDFIRMAYNYYRVTADASTLLYDMEKNGGYRAIENNALTTLDANISGFWGKSADEKVVRITSTHAEANLSFLENESVKYHASGEYPIVFECDFLPEAHVKNVRFSTGGSPASTAVYPTNNSAKPESDSTSPHALPAGFLNGRWSKLKTVVDYTTGTGATYVNGVKGGEFTVSPDSQYKQMFRLIVEWDDSTVKNPSDKKFCVDNVKVYEQKAPKPEEEVISLSKTANGYLLRGDEISFFGGEITDTVKTEMGVTDVKVFDSEKNYTPIAEGTALSDGNLIVMKNSAGTYGYYTAREHMLVAGGTGYVDDTTYTDGGLQFKATGGGVMIVAQYDNSGMLINVQVQDLTGATPFVSLEPADGAAFVKTFIFNSTSGLAPYMPKMELRYKASPDLTIACWGDSLTYGQGSTDVNVNSYPAVLKKKQA